VRVGVLRTGPRLYQRQIVPPAEMGQASDDKGSRQPHR
jgi:hypothetical protein